MKIELELAKSGYNSKLTIDGKPVYFSRIAILIDSPGPTKMQIEIPRVGNQPIDILGEGIQIVGTLEPGNLFIDILSDEPEPRAGRSQPSEVDP